MESNCGTMISPQKSLLLTILLVAGLVLSGCTGGRTVAKGWSGGTVSGNILVIGSMRGTLVGVNMSDGSRVWEATLESLAPAAGDLGCAPGSRTVAIYGSPLVAGDMVFVGGYDGVFYAFVFGRQEPRWVYPRQGNLGGSIVGGAILAQDKVYFSSATGTVYALNAADGYKVWEFTTGDKIWSTPAISGDTVFIGSFDNKLYALGASDGSKKWTFITGGALVATPLVSDNTVYIGSFDRHLYAVNSRDGSLKWKFMASNWFWARPVARNGIVYAGCLDGKVYALAANTGDKLAEFDLGSPLSSSPVVAGNSVIVATEAGVIYALGPDNEKRRLISIEEKVYAPLAAAEESVYVHTARDSLHAVDARSGAIREFNIK